MKVNELLSVLDKEITHIILIYSENKKKLQIYDAWHKDLDWEWFKGMYLEWKQVVEKYGDREIENVYPTKTGDIPSLAIVVKQGEKE